MVLIKHPLESKPVCWSSPVSPTFLRQVTQRFFFFLASLSPSLSSSRLLGPAQSALSSGSDFYREKKTKVDKQRESQRFLVSQESNFPRRRPSTAAICSSTSMRLISVSESQRKFLIKISSFSRLSCLLQALFCCLTGTTWLTQINLILNCRSKSQLSVSREKLQSKVTAIGNLFWERLLHSKLTSLSADDWLWSSTVGRAVLWSTCVGVDWLLSKDGTVTAVLGLMVCVELLTGLEAETGVLVTGGCCFFLSAS